MQRSAERRRRGFLVYPPPPVEPSKGALTAALGVLDMAGHWTVTPARVQLQDNAAQLYWSASLILAALQERTMFRLRRV